MYCDFVVCGIDYYLNVYLIIDRIYFNLIYFDVVIKKLEVFWRICILFEILGRWFIRRCDVFLSIVSVSGICFCRG